MTMDMDAKEAAILRMLDFWQGGDRMTDGQLSAFFEAAEEFSVEAVRRSCEQFRSGRVDRDNRWAPNAVEFAIITRSWQESLDGLSRARTARENDKLVSYPIGQLPPPPSTPLGPTKLEIAGVMTDVSDWTHEEKEEAITHGVMPKSRLTIGGGEHRIAIPVRRMSE